MRTVTDLPHRDVPRDEADLRRVVRLLARQAAAEYVRNRLPAAPINP